MTGLLTELMHERAETLDRPHFDVDGIVRAGDRRVRRRRTAVVGGVAALAVAVGVLAPSVLGGDERPTAVDPDLVAAFAAHSPSYAVGSEVTIEGRVFDVGRKIRAYVQTDLGIVFSDADGKVWASQGGDVTEVGHILAKVPILVADGSRAAWVEPGKDDAPPLYAVHDQVTGDTARTSLLNTAGMSSLPDGRNPTAAYALDGHDLYLLDNVGAAVWDSATGEVRRLSRDANGFTISDVHDGRIAYQAGDDEGVRIGTSLENGTPLGLWQAYDFSPDGRYILGEAESDDVRVFDSRTGEAMPKDANGYAYFGGYGWIDAEHYAAAGLTEPFEESPIDVFTCEVATGDCTVVAEDVATIDEGFTIPNGRYIN